MTKYTLPTSQHSPEWIFQTPHPPGGLNVVFHAEVRDKVPLLLLPVSRTRRSATRVDRLHLDSVLNPINVMSVGLDTTVRAKNQWEEPVRSEGTNPQKITKLLFIDKITITKRENFRQGKETRP